MAARNSKFKIPNNDFGVLFTCWVQAEQDNHIILDTVCRELGMVKNFLFVLL